MNAKEKSIIIWVTGPSLPENAVFARWTVWLHHQGEMLIQIAKVASAPDQNQSDVNAYLYHVRFSRWILENVSVDAQGIQDGDVFILVTRDDEKETVATLMQALQHFPQNLPTEIASRRDHITLKEIDEWQKTMQQEKPEKLSINAPGGTVIYRPEGAITMSTSDEPKSPWASGSFYLAAFLVVIVGLGVLANSVPFYVLMIVLISAILFVPLIGALQLRQDKRLSEKKFLELIGIIMRQLPLIGKIAKNIGHRTG